MISWFAELALEGDFWLPELAKNAFPELNTSKLQLIEIAGKTCEMSIRNCYP